MGAFCPLAIVYCYFEFKLRYLKNLKLFLIRVELFEPIVLRTKADGFVCLFVCFFVCFFFLFNFFFSLSSLFKSTFLRNRSLSNATRFYGKNANSEGKTLFN